MMTSTLLQERLRKFHDLGVDICEAMKREVVKAGVPDVVLGKAQIDSASFSLKEDPFTRQSTLEGQWRDESGHKKGEILFHGDGSFYAEYDVVQPHPSKSQWFIESVTAWGRDKLIKTEIKLLPVAG